MIKQAIILAAGKGSRMGEMGTQLPKPLIQVDQYPLMEYVLRLLVHYGVSKIGVNLHHQGDRIKDYFGSGKNWGTSIEYIEENILSGTAGGVAKVFSALLEDEDFFVISSDMLVNFDLKRLAETHIKNKSLATLSCFQRPKEQVKKSGLIKFDPNTLRVQDFLERPQTEEDIISTWVNSSVYAFSPLIIELIKNKLSTQDVVDLPKDIFPQLLEQQLNFYCQPFGSPDYYQLGVDSPDRIMKAEQDIIENKFKPKGF